MSDAVARLEVLKGDPNFPSVVFQRLAERETLKEIGKSLGLPKGRFFEWFTTQHGDLYDAALKVVAADLAAEAVEAAFAATPEDVSVRKLQADVALKLASRYDRMRYGESVRVEKSVELRADAALIGHAGALLKRLSARSADVVDAEVVPAAALAGPI